MKGKTNHSSSQDKLKYLHIAGIFIHTKLPHKDKSILLCNWHLQGKDRGKEGRRRAPAREENVHFNHTTGICKPILCLWSLLPKQQSTWFGYPLRVCKRLLSTEMNAKHPELSFFALKSLLPLAKISCLSGTVHQYQSGANNGLFPEFLKWAFCVHIDMGLGTLD